VPHTARETRRTGPVPRMATRVAVQEGEDLFGPHGTGNGCELGSTAELLGCSNGRYPASLNRPGRFLALVGCGDIPSGGGVEQIRRPSAA
jgi:hypothetical protein